jgi:protein involved in polysaccharide export with SLBB domain
MPRLCDAAQPRRSLHTVCGLITALVLSACAAAGKPMPEVADEINATRDPHTARFLPGDTVAIRFAHDPTMDQSVRVDSNGEASFLNIGRISLLGKIPEQVREELERAYAPKLNGPPDVSVNLIQLNPEAMVAPPNRAIHVTGEVHNPGVFPYGGQQVTLIDAIARAGGHLKATALLKQILFVRWMPEQKTWRSWKIDAREDYWGNSKQILMQANDLVYIPNTPIDDVDIWVDQYIRLLIPFPYLVSPATYAGTP